jgi:hypothetical protein
MGGVILREEAAPHKNEKGIGRTAAWVYTVSDYRLFRQATAPAMNSRRYESTSLLLSNNDCRRRRGSGSDKAPPAAQ